MEMRDCNNTSRGDNVGVCVDRHNLLGAKIHINADQSKIPATKVATIRGKF